MPFTLDQVVPWGRSYDEYVAMFALTEVNLRKRILGCGDGPASFNAGLTRRGGAVVSAQGLYRARMTGCRLPFFTCSGDQRDCPPACEREAYPRGGTVPIRVNLKLTDRLLCRHKWPVRVLYRHV
jgi:hypothetical protein